MKNRNYLLSVLFTGVLAAVLLTCVLLRLIFPLVILPRWNIPNLVLLSVIALVMDGYAAKGAKRNYWLVFAFAALSCALLPWATGWVAPARMLSHGLSGGIVFTATAWLFTSMTDRLSTGPAAKAAPIMGALGLNLASQCFQGILL